MMSYCYEIFHTLGICKHIVDTLSHHAVSSIDDRSLLECAAIEQLVEMQVRECLHDVREAEHIADTLRDPVALECLEHLKRDCPSKSKTMSGEMTNLFGHHDRLTNYCNLIMYDTAMYVALKLRKS